MSKKASQLPQLRGGGDYSALNGVLFSNAAVLREHFIYSDDKGLHDEIQTILRAAAAKKEDFSVFDLAKKLICRASQNHFKDYFEDEFEIDLKPIRLELGGNKLG